MVLVKIPTPVLSMDQLTVWPVNKPFKLKILVLQILGIPLMEASLVNGARVTVVVFIGWETPLKVGVTLTPLNVDDKLDGISERVLPVVELLLSVHPEP
jgi:hypothetical protein